MKVRPAECRRNRQDTLRGAEMSDDKKTKHFVLIAEAAALCVLLVWLATGLGTDAVPRVHWRIDERDDPVEAFAEVEMETPLTLEVDLPFDAYLYVASFEPVRGSIAMFPSNFLRSDVPANPLAEGVHRLPGKHGDVDLLWHSGDVPSPISFMVVVSRDRLPELEAAMKTFRQFGNAAFPQRRKLGSYAPDGGMASVPALTEVHTDVLRAAYSLPDPEHDGEMTRWPKRDGVWLKVLRLQVKGGPEPGQEPEDPRALLKRRLGEEFGSVLDPAELRQLGRPTEPR